MREIDLDLLPPRALFDSSILFGALGSRDDGPTAEACRKLFEAMIENGKTVLVSAPTIAELLRGESPVEPPRTAGVVVVGFDDQAARILAKEFPQEVLIRFRDATGTPLQYIKYDAMIVACAKRHRAECLVTGDAAMARLANHAGLPCFAPDHFYAKQGTLPGVAPTKPKRRPKDTK